MEVKVTLRNPLDHDDLLDYYIIPDEHQLAKDWLSALQEILDSKLRLQKEYCFLGFPNTHRTLEFLCGELNTAIAIINNYDFTKHGLPNYIIEEWFHPNVVRFPEGAYTVEHRFLDEETPKNEFGDYLPREEIGLKLKHDVMNRLHNHFERLEGTIERPSPYGQVSPIDVRTAIGKLNHVCHEMESLILSQRKVKTNPQWVRPSQITTFENRKRHLLTDDHRHGFLTNKYDRQFGHVYMHWTQIGKTLFEVFRDEGAPDLDEATCEAITHLQYYSGEFDVEWAKDVVRNKDCPWHDEEQLEFENWLLKNGLDPMDPKLSLGYLHIGRVDMERSFGSTDMFDIWNQLGKHLDIYKITLEGKSYEMD